MKKELSAISQDDLIVESYRRKLDNELNKRTMWKCDNYDTNIRHVQQLQREYPCESVQRGLLTPPTTFLKRVFSEALLL